MDNRIGHKLRLTPTLWRTLQERTLALNIATGEYHSVNALVATYLERMATDEEWWQQLYTVKGGGEK